MSSPGELRRELGIDPIDAGSLPDYVRASEIVELAMDAKLLHSFRQLLSDGINSAQWDLPDELPEPSDVGSNSRLLN